jgi:creatinine amidohydrolase
MSFADPALVPKPGRPTVREVRLERMLPGEVRDAIAVAPIAWLPLGAVEFHAEHLPFGTDGFSAQHVVERAARRAGGVVLPWSYVTLGTLAMPWSFRFDAALVEGVLRQTMEQLIGEGARVVVVHTGHGPLDLNHLIKRICAEVETSHGERSGVRAYGLCYLELNAALGAGLGTDWPVAVDHGSITETSWVMAMEPDLVDIQRLPDDPEATGLYAIYGPNPRGRATRDLGAGQIESCAALLAERATRLLAGERIDAMADLRTFVDRYWPEPLQLSGRAGTAGEAAVVLTNPGPVSRYLTGLDLRLDGRSVDAHGIGLVNPTRGETGVRFEAAALGPEAGFYVRRQQSADVRLPAAVEAGRHDVELELGLAGVTSTMLAGEVDFG